MWIEIKAEEFQITNRFITKIIGAGWISKCKARSSKLEEVNSYFRLINNNQEVQWTKCQCSKITK